MERPWQPFQKVLTTRHIYTIKLVYFPYRFGARVEAAKFGGLCLLHRRIYPLLGDNSSGCVDVMSTQPDEPFANARCSLARFPAYP